MRVAVIGGGGAGLTTAWLLGQVHQVTLFEAQAHVGGHAASVDVTADGVQVPVDVGVDVLMDSVHAATLRLMRHLRLTLDRTVGTVTLFQPGGRGLLLPPFRPGRIGWSTLTPRRVGQLLTLRRLLRQRPSAGADAVPFSVEEVLDALGADRRFREELFYPLAQGGWAVPPEVFRQLSAHNVWNYLAPEGGISFSAPRWLEVRGGMRAYAQALAADMGTVRLLRAAPVTGVRRDGGAYQVLLAEGEPHTADAVVLATNALQAAELLRFLPAAERLRRVLRSVRYAATRIAVHGDPALMPADRRDWSLVNARFDGRHTQLTMWKSWRQPTAGHIFKSYVTFDAAPPRQLHALHTFDHGIIDRTYFRAQRELAPLQGEEGLWLAGVYTAGIDSHESAIRSAVRIAERLAPGHPRLRLLQE